MSILTTVCVHSANREPEIPSFHTGVETGQNRSRPDGLPLRAVGWVHRIVSFSENPAIR